MTLKRLATIRQDSADPCPFGLPIKLACQHAGESIYRMVPLESIPKEKQEKYKAANRKVYIHHNTGERCPFADKIVEEKNIVNCDYGDSAEGISDTPLRPSPFYSRVFQGLGQTGMFSYPNNFYWDNTDAQQLFNGIFSMYASTGEVLIQKHSLKEPDPNLIDLYSSFFGKSGG